MALPVVAIVGRPNVGKSSLLNRLAGRRISIVDAMPGVTRDRVSYPLQVGDDGYVELVDTGGLGVEDADRLTDQIEMQIDYGIRSAALILFVVDAQAGLTPLDRHVAERLRRQDTPVLLLANKLDDPRQITEVHELHALGFGDPIHISAMHSLGIPELLDALAERLAGTMTDSPGEPVMKLAVVGKRNAGKSTFINVLAGEERVIVSETPGTTRDSVDVTVEIDGRRVTVIDTAGVRKKRSVEGSIEFYSQHRALRSIRRSDVTAMMVDASLPVSKVDKTLAGEIATQFKPVVFVVNKWDIASGRAAGEDYADYFDKVFPELRYAPISLTSAVDGTGVRETVELAEKLYEQARTRVGTGELNAILADILTARGPSHRPGTPRPKIYYASQVATEPPTIVLFVNDLRGFDAGYERYLLNRLRERLPYAEVPIRLIFRRRRPGRREGGPEPRESGRGG